MTLRRLAPLLALAAGCALFARSEGEVRDEFDAYVAGANTCTAASDCASASPGCPLGCQVAVRADRKADVEAKARDLIDMYERGGQSCIYDCAGVGPLVCEGGRCGFGSDAGGGP